MRILIRSEFRVIIYSNQSLRVYHTHILLLLLYCVVVTAVNDHTFASRQIVSRGSVGPQTAVLQYHHGSMELFYTDRLSIRTRT